MANKVQIYKAAMIQLGEDRVLNNPGDAPEFEEVFELVRDAVTRAHPWDCAEAIAEIPVDATAPAFGYDRRYPWPTDPYCLRPLKIEGRQKWRSRGRFIHTDATPPLQLTFLKRLDDIEEADALLADALAVMLAYRAAYAITRSRTKEADMLEAAQKIYLPLARTVDGQQGSARDVLRDDFLAARGDSDVFDWL